MFMWTVGDVIGLGLLALFLIVCCGALIVGSIKRWRHRRRERKEDAPRG